MLQEPEAQHAGPVTSSWAAATFAGGEEAQSRSIAAATPDARFRWLMDALDLAAATGALTRARADKQAWCDRVWGGETAPQP